MTQKRNWSAYLVPLGMIALVLLGYGVLYHFHHSAFWGTSSYNTYTLQALAWKNGMLSLGRDYPHLELAVFEGDWYVSFPPVPSVPLFLLTLVFGSQTPDGLLIKLYACVGALCLYFFFRKKEHRPASAAFWAVFVTFAGCQWAITQVGAVWYMAQVMAFCLMAASICCYGYQKRAACLFLYALAVGCRPFDALYGPVLLYLLYSEKQGSVKEKLLSLLPGVGLGLLVACAYGAYNYARFGNIFEFGHNYLPEFSTQGGVQFSLSHVVNNLKTFLLGWPFAQDGSLNKFGFSMLLANPVFLLLLSWFAADLALRRMTLPKAAMMALLLAQLFLLLLHRTFGGYQFGARYTCDLLPWAALYLGSGKRQKNVHWYEAALFAAAMAFAVYGGVKICV